MWWIRPSNSNSATKQTNLKEAENKMKRKFNGEAQNESKKMRMREEKNEELVKEIA